MLQLPPNFRNDIQGRDTALVPIIEIGNVIDPSGNNSASPEYTSDNYLISVGSQAPYISSEGRATLPLLLNIPSLKESIDIEKRNYKISSVNIDISNFPYEGKRFSELIGDKSLINTECRIWWASPSSTSREYLDLGYPIQPQAQLEIYFGTIRRYTHDDEKVKLVVEDRSQSKLHKDLPLTDNYLTGDGVPDKYKNKPIPMVYGHVDRSPCVVDTGKIIKIDSQNIVGLGNNTNDAFSETISPLLMNVDDSYLPVLEFIEEDLTDDIYNVDDSDSDSDILGTLYSVNVSDRQWKHSDNTSPLIHISSESLLTQNDIFQCKLYHKASSVEYIDTDTSFEENLLPDNVLAGLSDNSNIGINFVDTASLNIPVSGVGLPFMNTLAKLNIYTNTSISDILSKHTLGIMMNGVTLPIPKFASGNPDRIYYYNDLDTSQGAIGTRYRIDGMEFDGDIHTPPNGTQYDLSELIGFPEEPLDQDFNIYSPDGDIVVTHSTTQSNGESLGSTIGLFFFDWCGMGSDVDQDKYMIYFRVHHRFTSPDDNYLEYSLTTSADFKEIDIKTLVDVENILNKDFYANVYGREASSTGGSPSSATVIKHILENELGQVDIDAPTDSWEYAFTVNKKINSKKLIEEIASVSPHIPRFDNMGDFKFDTIPADGGSITSDDHTIKESDVIDFSFSRTKIEDVCTKVVFKYNWDYAREEFNSSVEVNTAEIVFTEDSNYDPTYYGFKEIDGDPHADSTFEISDHRGKYIRNEVTAQNFADWFLMWSCNQHLKMKIKLPLKYMYLEIGDIVDFDAILGGVNPYGIYYLDDIPVNGQTFYKNFIITSTSKTLEFVEIECIQMHNLAIADRRLTFKAEEYYNVICSDELDGVAIESIYEEFPELQYLTTIQEYGVSSPRAAQWSGTNWIGSLQYFEGGEIYNIKFSQDTITDLFSPNESLTFGSDFQISEHNVGGNVGVSEDIYIRDLADGDFYISDLSIRTQSVTNSITSATIIVNNTTYSAEITTTGNNQLLTFLSNTPVMVFNTSEMEDLDVRNHIYTFTITTADLETHYIHRNILYTFHKHNNIGDINGDGKHDILDVVSLANCVISGNCTDIDGGYACDINGDGGYSVLDITTLANCILAGTCE